jgi:hypothetical protein
MREASAGVLNLIFAGSRNILRKWSATDFSSVTDIP